MTSPGAAWGREVQHPVRLEPARLVLGQTETAVIDVAGIDGRGTVLAAVNVGRVVRVVRHGERVRVRYRLPPQRFPQRLCLLLWSGSDAGRVPRVVRLPLYGRNLLPVQTKGGATVQVQLGDELFGPVTAGAGGSATVGLQVPPGVRFARVERVQPSGERSVRTVRLDQPPHNMLTLAVQPDPLSGTAAPRVRITVAVADPRAGKLVPLVRVGRDSIRVRRASRGVWSGWWQPGSRPGPGPLLVQAELAGDVRSLQQADLDLSGSDIVVRPRRPPVRQPPPLRRWVGLLGLSAGLSHNLGDLVLPRFGLELGLELRLPAGYIGLRALAAVSWDSQQVDAPAGLQPAEASLLLLPLGGAISYRAPLRWLTPYVIWGCQAQLVRSEHRAPYLDRARKRLDVTFSVLGLLGASRQLGPGRLFLQGGYQWSRLDSSDLDLLAGGIVLEGGYRFEL